MPRNSALLAVIALLVAACAAVGPKTGIVATPTASSSTPSPMPSPSTPAGGQTYTDSGFGFSVAYPRGYTFQSTGSTSDGAGYRAVDNRYLGGYPPGQVEVNLYSMDSDTVSNWISKHTGPLTAPASEHYYWPSATNVHATIGARRPAIYFEARAESTTIHATAFRQGPRVAILDWWSKDPTYSTTVESVAQQMLASFRD